MKCENEPAEYSAEVIFVENTLTDKINESTLLRSINTSNNRVWVEYFLFKLLGITKVSDVNCF